MSTDISLWLAALVVLLIIEMITQGLTTVWFAIGCAGAAVCAAFDLPILVQCIVFLIISVITLLFTRPIAVKYFNSKSVPTNVEALFGTEARVIEKIDPIEGTGRVNVGGQEWMAATDDDHSPEVGEVVEITGVRGTRLIVRRKNENTVNGE